MVSKRKKYLFHLVSNPPTRSSSAAAAAVAAAMRRAGTCSLVTTVAAVLVVCAVNAPSFNDVISFPKFNLPEHIIYFKGAEQPHQQQQATTPLASSPLIPLGALRATTPPPRQQLRTAQNLFRLGDFFGSVASGSSSSPRNPTVNPRQWQQPPLPPPPQQQQHWQWPQQPSPSLSAQQQFIHHQQQQQQQQHSPQQRSNIPLASTTFSRQGDAARDWTVAILVIGQNRGLGTSPEHVLLRHKLAHLVDPLRAEAKRVELFMCTERVLANVNAYLNVTAWHVARFRRSVGYGGYGGRGGYSGGLGLGGGADVGGGLACGVGWNGTCNGMFMRSQACFEFVTQWSQRNRVRFDWFIRDRPDTVFMRPPPPLACLPGTFSCVTHSFTHATTVGPTGLSSPAPQEKNAITTLLCLINRATDG